MTERGEHDWGMCWCAECTRRLLAANDEYLKQWLTRSPVYEAMVAEIERLRAQREEEFVRSADGSETSHVDREAVIRNLIAENKQREDVIAVAQVAIRNLEAEIEWLRAHLAHYQRVYHETQWRQLNEAQAEIERLRAENHDRLRANKILVAENDRLRAEHLSRKSSHDRNNYRTHPADDP